LIASVDGITGFSDATPAVFPETVVQFPIIHQIRNSL
jgi:transposase-like protein